ncbi:MAG: hypothetical protein IH962_02950 [Chloroflexi bacterium]|nr:hypothetical protein [Chloroflexota bacterium]
MQQGDSQNRRLYVGLQEGVCAVTSSDGGKHWERGPITPLAHAAARLTASPVAPQRAFLAAYEAGVYRTDDGGLSWQHLSSYPTDYAHSVVAHANEEQTVYAGSEPAAIYRSPDGGETWEECSSFQSVPESKDWGFHAETRDSHVRDLRMAPHDPSYLYAGIEVGGMVGSKDGGGSWKQLPGLHDDIHCISLSKARPSTVYVATARAPYRSDDEGGHWEVINTGLERTYTLHIAAAPDDADLVLVTVSSNARRQNPLFYRSTDGGRSWGLVKELSLGDDMVVSFEWDPVVSGRVYAATESGKLFNSADHGQSWQQLPVELPALAVGALAVGHS